MDVITRQEFAAGVEAAIRKAIGKRVVVCKGVDFFRGFIPEDIVGSEYLIYVERRKLCVAVATAEQIFTLREAGRVFVKLEEA